MILFILGLIVGAAVSGTLVYLQVQRAAQTADRELALLRARLRTLMRLAEAGLLIPDTVEAANVLNDVHEMVTVPGASPVRSSVDVSALEEDDESVPSVFGR